MGIERYGVRLEGLLLEGLKFMLDMNMDNIYTSSVSAGPIVQRGCMVHGNYGIPINEVKVRITESGNIRVGTMVQSVHIMGGPRVDSA
jgi:hypothetical protein